MSIDVTMGENIKKDVTVPVKTVWAVAEAHDVKVSIKDPFSLRHAYHACLLAKLAKDFETSKKRLEALSNEIRFENTAYVISAVFASAAFLEAMINEEFSYATDQVDDVVGGASPVGHLKVLSTDAILSMGNLWSYGIEFDGCDGIELDEFGNRTAKQHRNLANCILADRPAELSKDVERWSFELKFQLALYLCGHPQSKSFYEHDPLWKDINVLYRLRNHFTHYKPERHTSGSRGHPIPERRATRRLAHELRTRGFDNPLFRATGGIPLEGFLGAKCARWVATAGLSFADTFARDTKIELYQQVRDLLSTCAKPL